MNRAANHAVQRDLLVRIEQMINAHGSFAAVTVE